MDNMWGWTPDECRKYFEAWDEEEEETCEHEYVNVSFMSLVYICKHCEKEKK